MTLRPPTQQQQVVITVEPRYIDRDKLKELLARLFPPKTYAVEVRRGRWVISTPEPLTMEQIDSCGHDLGKE